MKKKFLPFMAVAIAMAAPAQESAAPDYGDFIVDAQVRTLGEYRGGIQSEEDARSKLFVNDRVRLSFGWGRKNISMKIAAQHIGLWQNNSQKSTFGKIDLHEAWARMTFGKSFFTQVGRQELSYDDERLLGANDWATSGRAHDALRLGWENTRNKFHAIVSFNQTAEMTDDINIGNSSSNTGLYKNMQMLWYHFGANQSPFQISALFLNQGVSDAKGDGVNYMQTFGIYTSYEKRKISADFSFYYQTGHDRTGADLRAFMLGGNFGWQMAPKLGVTIGDDYLSGSDGLSDDNRTFNLLYGSYHKFFGAMDCFGNGVIPTYGLNDLNLGIKFIPSQKFDMNLACHWLATPNQIKDYLKNHSGQFMYSVYKLDPESQDLIRNYYGSEHRFMQILGTELDLQVSYRPWKFVTIQAGYSMLIGTDTVQLLMGENSSKTPQWGWISFDITPTIFSTRHHR